MSSSEKVINSIINYLQNQRGFDFAGYNREMLQRRIESRIKKKHCKSTNAYYHFLINNDAEINSLIDTITIHISSFCRDPMVYEILYGFVLKRMAKEKKVIRIWSAACACGEEPYSVAMYCNDLLEKEKKELTFSICATDIDQYALDKANTGSYDLKSVHDIRFKWVKKYFTNSENDYLISRTIKKMVNFSLYNLLDCKTKLPYQDAFGHFDIVLCRNVLMYYNEAYQNIILDNISHSIPKNGILILGESEMLTEKFRNSYTRITSFSKIYKKAI